MASLVQLIGSASGVLQAQLGVQVVQLPVTAQQEAPHLRPGLLTLLHSAFCACEGLTDARMRCISINVKCLHPS